jgi:uncharacterized protein (TIGR02466 family)
MLEINEFSVPFYGFEWEDADKHKDRLKEICHLLEQNNSTSGVAPGAKHGLYESAFNFLNLEDPSVTALANFVNQSIWKSASKANEGKWDAGMQLAVKVHESWCHICRPGAHHDKHIHGNSSWSCIYYIDVGDSDNETKNGLTRFYNALNSSYFDMGTMWMTAKSSIDINNKDGLLLVFPSFIYHSQLPYTSEEGKNRYVVAANSKIVEVKND